MREAEWFNGVRRVGGAPLAVDVLHVDALSFEAAPPPCCKAHCRPTSPGRAERTTAPATLSRQISGRPWRRSTPGGGVGQAGGCSPARNGPSRRLSCRAGRYTLLVEEGPLTGQGATRTTAPQGTGSAEDSGTKSGRGFTFCYPRRETRLILPSAAAPLVLVCPEYPHWVPIDSLYLITNRLLPLYLPIAPLKTLSSSFLGPVRPARHRSWAITCHNTRSDSSIFANQTSSAPSRLQAPPFQEETAGSFAAISGIFL